MLQTGSGDPARAGPPAFWWSTFERLARLEQRLQPAEHVAPATRHALGGLGGRLKLVVDDGQLRDASLLRLDLPRDPAVRLGRRLRVVERAPGVPQHARRVRLEDLAVDELLVAVARE